MSDIKPRNQPRMTEKQTIAAGVERSNTPEPWRSAILAECNKPGRYSTARVALAVRAQIENDSIVASSALEYSRAVRKGPRGCRPSA
jgi:hypothetical protein